MMTSNDDDAPFEPQHGDSSPAIAASAATVAVWNANDILEGVEDIVLSGPSGDADEDSDTSTLQNTPTSLHDQVADLAKKFESALDLPKEWLDPSRALLERFLDLQRPRLDPKMMECFQMNGFVDLFLSFITRPGPVDESTKGPDDPVAVRRANNATDVLCGVDEWSLQLLETKVDGLLRLFAPGSRGSFQDLRRICDNMLNRSPATLLKAVVSLPSATLDFISESSRQRPLLFYFAERLEQQAVGGIIVACLMLPVSKQNKLERITRFDTLRKEKFLEHVLTLFRESTSPAFVSGAADFMVRLIEEAARTDDAWLLFRSIETDPSIIDSLIEVAASKDSGSLKQRTCVEVIYAFIFRSIYRPPRPILQLDNDSNDVQNLSLKDVRRKVLEQCASKIADLCHVLVFGSFQVAPITADSRAAKHFTVSRMQLVEIIYEVIREVPDQRHDVLLAVPWKALVNWFFEHKSNNSLHTTFYKIFDLLIKTQQTQTLRTILTKCKMLPRLMDAFEDRDQKGIAILMCNAVRLAALKEAPGSYLRQLLDSTDRWPAFLEELRRETTRQITPTIMLDTLKPSPFLTPLPSAPASDVAADGIDLGSKYAAIMGFSPPKAAPSPIKTAAELSAAMESPVKPKQAVDLITPDFPSPDTPKKRKNKKGKKKKGKKEDSAESSDATDDDGAEDQEE